MYNKFLKRFFDIIASFFAIVILAIPMLIIAIIIKLDSKGPIVFTQERIEKKKKHFKIYKFRTMRTDTPANMPPNHAAILPKDFGSFPTILPV